MHVYSAQKRFVSERKKMIFPYYMNETFTPEYVISDTTRDTLVLHCSCNFQVRSFSAERVNAHNFKEHWDCCYRKPIIVNVRDSKSTPNYRKQRKGFKG